MNPSQLTVAGDTFDLVRLTRSNTTQAALDASAFALFQLFLIREKEFDCNPNVTVDYPAVEAPPSAPFLTQPAAYIDGLLERLNGDAAPAIGRVVILTTFADRLTVPLRAEGYSATPVSMPAGPDFTACFERELDDLPGGRTLYIEAVNEADEKIRPSFSIELRDGEGRLRGGACGAVHEFNGKRFAYVAAMTLDVGLPPSTGIALGKAMLAFLRRLGVNTVHLGTQTAGPFYQKLGFRTVHTVLPRLRSRQGVDGQMVFTDLVMMEADL